MVLDLQFSLDLQGPVVMRPIMAGISTLTLLILVKLNSRHHHLGYIPSQQLQCTLSGDTLENDQQLEWEQNMMNSLLAGARYKNHMMHVLRDFY